MRETKYWVWHMFAGMVILVLLGIHMSIIHLDILFAGLNSGGGDATDWVKVVARGRLLTFGIAYIVLLATALYHGLYGLRTILLELEIKADIQKLISILLLVTGICLFTLGAWATATFYFSANAL